MLELFKYDYKFLELDYRIKKNINKNVKKRKIGNVKIINSFDDVSVEKIISQKTNFNIEISWKTRVLTYNELGKEKK